MADDLPPTNHDSPHRPELEEPRLSQLRADVMAHLRPGMPAMTCLVCTQRVKLYRRKLHSGMAYALVRLYRFDRAAPGQFMDYRDRNASGESRNHPYLRFWDLIEPDPTQASFWRITEHGRAFVEGRLTVPRAMWHFNDACHGFTDEPTSIRQALGDRFDLDELLASPAEPG